MAEQVRDFSELKSTLIKAPTKGPEQSAAPAEGRPKLDKQGRAYATGKRKDAVARVWVKQGPGKITVNGKDHVAYFARPVLQMILKQPLVTAKREGQYDIICTVSGGGLSGQAGAVRHGISKALTRYEPELRGVLKKGGFLTSLGGSPENSSYKGYGLALLCELLAGAVAGGGTLCTVPFEADRIGNNMLSFVVDPGRLPGAAALEQEIATTIDHVKASPPADPALPVLVAGEPERAWRAARSAAGIPVELATWAEIRAVARSFELDV